MKYTGIRMNQWKNRVGLALAAVLVTSCSGGSASDSAPNTGGSQNNPVTSSSSCNTTVVDYGNHNASVAGERGLSSDVKVNPVTGLPVVAYTDAGEFSVIASGGSNAIMLSYQVLSGSGDYVWQHEVVAGDNAQGLGASYIRLAMTSTGIPMVFWVTGPSGGTQVFMAGRNVALGSSTAPVWTVGPIDTSTHPGPMEVSVNPNNQVALVYESAVAAGVGVPRFLFCSSNCNNYVNYQGMAGGVGIDTATGGAGIAQAVGAAWCNAGSGTYYPAVAYYGGGASSAKYAICQNSNLANCELAGNWTSFVASAAVTPANADTVKLYIDPSVVGDRPKLLARTAGAATLSAIELGSGCNVAPVAGSSAVLPASGATSGNAFATILKDAGQYYHLVFNISTTSVAYENSNTAGPTGVFGAAAGNWNAVQTVETTTLPTITAAQVTNGGAALFNGTTPSTNGVLYASYGTIAGEFNLTLGTVSGLSGNATSVLALEYPNTAGGIQMSNQVAVSTDPLLYRNISMATTSTGSPAVAYVDYSGATTTAATAVLSGGTKLKYAYRNGTSHSSDWIVNIVPGPILPQYPSLVFDANNLPWIGYMETTTFGGNARYILMNNSKVDGTGTWNSYVFPFFNKGAVAEDLTGTGAIADDVALAIYNSGGISYPVMVVASSAGTTGIKATFLDPITGQWNPTAPATIDAIASGIEKLAIDYDGTNVAIAYYNVALGKLEVASSSNGGVTWSGPTAASGAGFGQGPSIKLLNGIPSVAYYNKTTNNVYYSQCTASTLSNCSSNPGSWSTTVQVNSGGGGNVGVSGMTNTADQYLSTSINFDTSGNAYVYFPLGYATGLTTAGLAVSSGAANMSGGNLTQSMLYSATTAMTSVNPLAAQNNFALAGQQVSTARNATTGVPFAAYIGPGNWLYTTSCGD